MLKTKSNNHLLPNHLLIGLLFLINFLPLEINAKDNPHTKNVATSNTQKECLSCHLITPNKPIKDSGQYIIPKVSQMKKDGVAMCAGCHSESENSHIVGVTPDYRVPADLPLTKNGQVNCLTCHYVHGSLKSNKPMASVSAMDKLFNRDRLKKSFLLRRDNSEGDLCLACHKKKEK